MTILHQFIYFVMLAEIIGAALFIAACAIGIGLWGYSTWSGRGKP